MVEVLLAAVYVAWPPQGSLSVELRRLAREDQAARQFKQKPTSREEAAMKRGDRLRQARGRQILAKARTLSADDFSALALLFQHGESAADYELAHLLAICACGLGKIESMPALTEDRYLKTVGRTQRFGTQFTGFGDHTKLDPVDEARPVAVTDELRQNYLVPPLQASKALGLRAIQTTQPSVFERLAKRRNPNQPLLGHPEISAELALLKPSNAGRLRVLALYNEDMIVTAGDYLAAARILSSSGDSRVLLLSHEFAVLAFAEGKRPAGPLVAQSWHRFAATIGRQPHGFDYPSIRATLSLP